MADVLQLSVEQEEMEDAPSEFLKLHPSVSIGIRNTQDFRGVFCVGTLKTQDTVILDR